MASSTLAQASRPVPLAHAECHALERAPADARRARSVAGLAEARHNASLALLCLLPYALLLWSGEAVVQRALVLAHVAFLVVLSVLDAAALRGAMRDARRLDSGRGPSREGVDYGVGTDMPGYEGGAPYRESARAGSGLRGCPRCAARVLSRSLAARALLSLAVALTVVGVSWLVQDGHLPSWPLR